MKPELRHRWSPVLVALLAALAMPLAGAATYYVDAELGRDGASGNRTDINGADGPLRSLAAVSRLSLFPGDQVLLKCGQTFPGPLRIRTVNQGGEGSLKLGAYGPCDTAGLPTVTGAVSLGAGEEIAGGLRQWKLDTTVTQLQVDGEPLAEALLPARGYHIWAQDGTADNQPAALAQLAGRQDVSGVRVRVRSQEWYLEERRLRRGRYQPELDRALEYPVRKGVGIYLGGKAWMIGTQPSWAYDEDRHVLTARLPAGRRPVVTASMDEPLVHITGPGSVALSQWRLVDAGSDALRVHLDGFLQLRDVRIERAERHGMSITGVPYVVIERNHVEDTGQDGIFFAESARVFVRQNTVLRAGLWGPPKPALAAINALRTDRAVIEENLVDGSGYIGIRFLGDAQVRRNIVARTCQRLSDCAGIYTWRRNLQHVTPPCVVEHNTVLRVAGDTTVKYSANDWFSGIYLDDFTQGVTVSQNVVADAEQGIYVHNAVRNAVLDNLVIGSRERQLVLGIDADRFPKGDKLDNDVRGNELLPGSGVKLPAAWPPAGQLSLVEAGKRRLAVGWVDWAKVDWSAAAPGCRPAGKVAAGATAVLLDCAKAARP